MEFADKIRIPKLNGVTMRGPHISNPSTGTLVITGHHLIFSSRSEDVELWVNNQSWFNIYFSNSENKYVRKCIFPNFKFSVLNSYFL